MVVKTELCNYTEYKIYPGRGQKFVAKDGRVSFFLSAKADSLFHQRIKAVKLTWSQAWRRMNKKGKIESSGKKNKKKTTKFQKAIAGLSLEDMQKKRAQKTELRAAAKDVAVKEAKARQTKKASRPAGTKQAQASIPKQQKQGGAKKDFKGRK